MSRGGATFGPSLRLKKRRQFLHIQSAGRKIRSQHFLIAYEASNGGSSRLGITVTTKVSKRAVARNHVKRCVREVFRQTRESFAWNGDFVVIALAGATELSFAEIRLELAQLALRARLVRRCDECDASRK